MPPRRLAWTVAVVAALTMTVSYVDRNTFAVLAPTVTKALGVSETAYGLMNSAFSIAYLVSVPAFGWWLDRTGARRGLTMSLFAWSLVAAVHMFVPGVVALFALRVLLGAAEGPAFPATSQTMVRVLPEHDRPRGFSFLFTGSSIGAMIAPPLASALYAAAGWRLAFLGTAAIGLLWVPLWLLVTRDRSVREALDAEALPHGPREPFLSLVRFPPLLLALCGILAVAPAMGLVMSWGAKILVRLHDVPQQAVGHYLWLPPVGMDLGALLFGDLAARRRKARPGAPRALFLVATLLTGTLVLLPWTSTPWATTACMATLMAGVGGVYTLVTADLLSRVHPTRTASMAGLLATGQSLAFVVAHPLVGRLVDATGGYSAPALVLAAWMVPGAAVWWAGISRAATPRAPGDVPSAA